MTQREIKVVSYDPQWTLDFAKERALLSTALGNVAIKIEHIGSTAVKGLSAKPILDILIEVSCLNAMDELNSNLEAIGYKAKGENGIIGRRYFQKGGVNRTHHVHAFLSGDENLIRHRAFKEYLIAHPDVLKAYETIKIQAAKDCNNDNKLYMLKKNDFIKVHEKLALNWFCN